MHILDAGTNGAISGGTDVTSTTSSMSDSQSNAQNGSELVYDPTGGGAFEPSISQSSFASSYYYSVENGGMALGTGGTISGGNDSFTFNQSNSDSHTLVAYTASYSVTETFTDTYTLNMLGTETDGPGGNVSGGADSYTWDQTLSDYLTLVQYDDLVNTLGTYTDYNVSLNDLLVDEFNDVGTDVLGASDSILGGCDTYSSVMSRVVNTSVDDSGNGSGSPYFADGLAGDTVNEIDSGSSTLTTNGHVYSTDSFTYAEQSGDTATSSLGYGTSLNGGTELGTAYDVYVDNDQGVITVSDATTTSQASFSMGDIHSISGYWSTASLVATESLNYYDHGSDDDSFDASGSDNSSGDEYTFTDNESSYDYYVLAKSITNSYMGTANEYSDVTNTMTGSTSTGLSGSSFSFSVSNTFFQSDTDYGSMTDGTIITPFSEYAASSATYRYSVTGPPDPTVYQESIESATFSGSNPPPVEFTETYVAGHGDTSGAAPALKAGSSPVDSAEHLGTTPAELETSGGLAAAMGGFAVHSLLFAGPEVMAEVNSAGNALNLQESYSSASPTNWVSHPSGIGYRRPSPAGSSSSSGSGSSGISGYAPINDSGTSDGSNDEELARLANFDTGGNENPTGTQTAPTSRAEQRGGATNPSGVDQPKLSGVGNGGNGGNDGNDGETGDGGDGDDSDGGDGEDGDGGEEDGGDVTEGDGSDTGDGVDPGDDGYLHFDNQFLEFIANNPAYDPIIAFLRYMNGTSDANSKQITLAHVQGLNIPALLAANKASIEIAFPGGGTACLMTSPLLTGNETDNLTAVGTGRLDSLLSGIDSVAAGLANNITAGLTNRAREALYGEIATNNQQGALYHAGSVAGFGVNLALGIVNPCKVVAGVETALRSMSGLQGIGFALNAYDSYRKGDAFGAILNGLGTIASLGQFSRACFAAGTPLLTPDGSKPIDEFLIGDLVLSRDEDDPHGQVVAKRVIATIQTYSPQFSLHVGGQIIRTTAEHPFWAVGRGWVAAHQLEAGDLLLGFCGEPTVLGAIDGPNVPGPVFNLEIETHHTYFVGATTWGFSVWSHNSGCDELIAAAQEAYPNKVGYELHHIIPKYLGGAAQGETVSLPAAYHQMITNAFRAAYAYGQSRPDAATLASIVELVYSKLPLP